MSLRSAPNPLLHPHLLPATAGEHALDHVLAPDTKLVRCTICGSLWTLSGPMEAPAAYPD